MQDLEEEYLTSLEKDKFVERLAHYYCEINVLHPFRVGSGFGTADLLRATGDSCRISTELAGYRKKEVWNQANQNGAMGISPRCR